MFRSGLLPAFALLVLSLGTVHAQEFPYTARANTEDVYIRSGPGKNYYPTDKLRPGDTVEVYRHDPGGWCAIRPPEKSFSWVATEGLEDLGNHLARARENDVVARVGSRFTDLRDVVQVRLAKGESVEVIDRSPDGHWCKIAPPSGEFRWVNGKFLDRRGIELSEGDDDDSDDEDIADDRGSRRDNQFTRGDSARGVRLASHEGDQWRESSAGTTEPAHSGRSKHSRKLSPGIHREIIDTDLALSMEVSKDVSEWSLGPLHDRAERALENSQTALERGRVRLLIGKIARFQDIKRRHDQLRSGAPADRTGTAVAYNQRVSGDTSWTSPDGRSGAVRQFDATGRLLPVSPGRAGLPRYALVDAQGRFSTLITAAPGVDLAPYINRQIAVQGPHTYLPEARKQHVSVERVRELTPPVEVLADRDAKRRFW